jgi:zinc finger protein
MEIINYDRTFEQNEELGLNDMKTENYEESWPELKRQNGEGDNFIVFVSYCHYFVSVAV